MHALAVLCARERILFEMQHTSTLKCPCAVYVYMCVRQRLVFTSPSVCKMCIYYHNITLSMHFPLHVQNNGTCTFMHIGFTRGLLDSLNDDKKRGEKFARIKLKLQQYHHIKYLCQAQEMANVRIRCSDEMMHDGKWLRL